MAINEFQGYHRFLSNFYPASVEMDKLIYPTVEHAFQAAKTADPEARKAISKLATPGQAKRAGRNLQLRPDWEYVKLEIMKSLVIEKFTRSQHLTEKLKATGSQELIEGNYWNDTFWGVCRGVGRNHLGRILMQVREELAGK